MKKFAIILMIFSLAGCANVPTNSAIREGALLGAVSDGSIVRVIASFPQDGMTPDEIVTGFLNASASSENDFRIAREYLVPDKKITWNPTQVIKVYEGEGLLNSLQENTIIFSAPSISTIDDKSRAVLSDLNSQIVEEFRLVEIEGQWRIDSVPEGLLISNADLNRSFVTFPLWFPDSSLKTLVPDNVVLPRSATGTATRLMQLLLAGPSEKLAGAVKSAFPVGTNLSLNSVPVSNGLATISLNENVLSAEPFLRELLSAQIVKTLTRIPEIRSIRINVGSQPLVVPDTPIRQSLSDWENFSPDFNRGVDAFAIENKKIVTVNSEGFTPVSDDYFAAGDWFAAVSSRDGKIIAGVNLERTSLIVQDTSQGTPRRVIVTGQGMKVPRTDIYNSVWITAVDQVSVVQNNRAQNVVIDGVEKQNIIDVIPAPDGVRVVVLIKTTNGTEIRLGNIIRDDQIVRINSLTKVMREGFAITQATWQDETTLIYLENSNEASNVYAIDTFTGVSKFLYSQVGAVNIAAALKKPLLITLDDGSMWERLSGDWILRGQLQNAGYPG